MKLVQLLKLGKDRTKTPAQTMRMAEKVKQAAMQAWDEILRSRVRENGD